MLKRNFKAFIAVFFIVFAIGCIGSLAYRNLQPGPGVTETPPEFNAAGLNFANYERLIIHFQKHGDEFGYHSADEYLSGAQRLIGRREGVMTFTRNNGDRLFYDQKRNEFAVVSAQGNIRTYFRPNTGIQYWYRQTGER